ncbi:hypothetical protein DXT99_07510 [Pontibacter diazotrophicus]|uniref:Uncharacterized protein n=1 Tax=Pontibacter diazotrophicus TaxID=1400979 RepID=A0A3D8LEM4_9BACT|nr:hypothetical protein DXT99_07510 [Pontibacter diazotrophicus]
MAAIKTRTMLKVISILFAVVGLVYFLFYPFLKNSINRKKLFKWFFILYIISLIVSTVGTYFL